MTEARFALLDRLSAGALVLWAGVALGVGLLAAPAVFQGVSSRMEAGASIGQALQRVDLLAWVAFSGALLLSGLPRWLAEVGDGPNPIGPLRLWVATLLAALLMCMASTFIVTPRVEAHRLRLGAQLEALSQDHPDRQALRKAHGVSRQMFFLRVLLALGLASTVGFLPRRREATEAS